MLAPGSAVRNTATAVDGLAAGGMVNGGGGTSSLQQYTRTHAPHYCCVLYCIVVCVCVCVIVVCVVVPSSVGSK